MSVALWYPGKEVTVFPQSDAPKLLGLVFPDTILTHACLPASLVYPDKFKGWLPFYSQEYVIHQSVLNGGI